MQAPTSCSQANVIKDEQDLGERRLQLRREARKGREQSRWSEETSQEAQKRLKAQRWRDASRRQCQTAEQTARRLLDQREGNARPHENETTIVWQLPSDKSTYTTGNFVFRNDVSKNEQDLNVKLCSQTALISG